MTPEQLANLKKLEAEATPETCPSWGASLGGLTEESRQLVFALRNHANELIEAITFVAEAREKAGKHGDLLPELVAVLDRMHFAEKQNQQLRALLRRVEESFRYEATKEKRELIDEIAEAIEPSVLTSDDPALD